MPRALLAQEVLTLDECLSNCGGLCLRCRLGGGTCDGSGSSLCIAGR